MATTLTFKGVLFAGLSYLKVLFIISVMVFSMMALGVLCIKEAAPDNEALMYIGGIFFVASGILLLIGSIGLGQKLLSDAFYDGFHAAQRAAGHTPKQGKMGVAETLLVGARLILIVGVTIVLSCPPMVFGAQMLETGFTEESHMSVLGGAGLSLLGATVFIAVAAGLIVRNISEAVAFGAHRAGVFRNTDSLLNTEEPGFSPSTSTTTDGGSDLPEQAQDRALKTWENPSDRIAKVPNEKVQYFILMLFVSGLVMIPFLFAMFY